MILSDNEDQFSLNSQHKKQKHSSKKYAVIDQQKRVLLLKQILSKESTIKQAAQQFGVNISTAKAILKTYREEGRIGKKKRRDKDKNKNKKGKDEPHINVYNIRKVQSMYDLEREIQIPQKYFSPDLKTSDKQLTKCILQQQSLLLLGQTNQQQYINNNLQNTQITLAIYQRELEQQKLLNMQLAIMLQNYQKCGFQNIFQEIKQEDDNIN